MKKIVLRYGTYGILIILVFFIMTWITYGNSLNKDFAIQEVIGYAAIFIATIFVFFGLKHYRDHENNGKLSFGEGIKLGLLIILFPAAAFALFDVLYVLFVAPDFLDTYYNYQLEEMRKTLPASTVELKRKEMESQKEMFSNPVVQFIVMFLTVFLIGVIVTVISSLVLKRQKIVHPQSV